MGFCGAFTCFCFFCSRIQYGCKRDNPKYKDCDRVKCSQIDWFKEKK
jgi:hypothetical protein